MVSTAGLSLVNLLISSKIPTFIDSIKAGLKARRLLKQSVVDIEAWSGDPKQNNSLSHCHDNCPESERESNSCSGCHIFSSE